MKLYEIANEYQLLLDQLCDEDTGEINLDAFLKLDDVKLDLKEKGIAVAAYIKNMDADRKAIKEAMDNMRDRAAVLQARIDNLENYLQCNMEKCSITEISSPYFAIKLKKCPVSVDIIDETLIPEEYLKVKQVSSPDKLKIKDAIFAGSFVPGTVLKQNNRLEIK